MKRGTLVDHNNGYKTVPHILKKVFAQGLSYDLSKLKQRGKIITKFERS